MSNCEVIESYISLYPQGKIVNLKNLKRYAREKGIVIQKVERGVLNARYEILDAKLRKILIANMI